MDDVVTVEAIDFSRSFLWWRIDTDKVPPGTITAPTAVDAILANRRLVAPR